VVAGSKSSRPELNWLPASPFGRRGSYQLTPSSSRTGSGSRRSFRAGHALPPGCSGAPRRSQREQTPLRACAVPEKIRRRGVDRLLQHLARLDESTRRPVMMISAPVCGLRPCGGRLVCRRNSEPEIFTFSAAFEMPLGDLEDRLDDLGGVFFENRSSRPSRRFVRRFPPWSSPRCTHQSLERASGPQ